MQIRFRFTKDSVTPNYNSLRSSRKKFLYIYVNLASFVLVLSQPQEIEKESAKHFDEQKQEKEEADEVINSSIDEKGSK